MEPLADLDIASARLPRLVALVMQRQAREAQRIARQYDRRNERGELLRPRATVFDMMDVNGFAGDDGTGDTVFGLTLGMYAWCLQLSAAGAGAGSPVVQPLAAGTDRANVDWMAAAELRGHPKRRHALSNFLDMTWAVWRHELAHVVAGHTKIARLDGGANWLSEFGHPPEGGGLDDYGERQVIEADADCRASSMQTAMLIDSHEYRSEPEDRIGRGLEHYFFGVSAFFLAVYGSRGARYVAEPHYPSPLARIVYALTTARMTLDVNGMDGAVTENALQRALGRVDELRASCPGALPEGDFFSEGLAGNLKDELWDIGARSRMRREEHDRFVFQHPLVETVPSPGSMWDSDPTSTSEESRRSIFPD